MGKTLGYGEITVANMTEPFTVMLTNEAQQFATDSNRKVTSAQSYYTDIIVIRGSQERTDYTIGNITSGSGITVSKSSKRITFSVSAGTTIGADAGVIEIPITLDGQTVKKQFSWSCGKQGPQGVKGDPGTSVKITSKSVTYQTSTSGTTAPTGTWSTTVPTVNNGQYLWTKTTVQYSDGNKTEAYSVSYKGTNGTNGTSVTVSKTEVTYQVSASGTTAPTGTWSTTMPSCDQGQYLWTKTYVKYSDGKDTTSYSVSYKGVDGEKFAFNMLRETNQGSKHWVNLGASGKYSVESITTDDNINAAKLICTEAIASNEWQFCDFSDYEMLKSLKASTTYTLSYDIKANRSGKILHNIKTGGGQKVFFANDIACKVLGNETWEHVSLKMTSGTTLPNLDGQVIYMFGDALSKVGYSIIKNLKLTEGIVDTPWAPHPEDLEGRGVSETVQYYLATSQASGVTSSTSGWSTDITTQKLTADKKYLWNCYQTKYSDGTSEPISTPKVIGVYGDKGQKGDNAKNLSITPSSQYFKSTDGGKTFAPNTITIKPTIQGEISFGKWQYSIDGGVSFADVVSGQKGLTVNNNVLTVSKDSSLYSDAVTMVTFRAVANDSSFYDTCSIAKIYDVSDIQIGGRNLLLNSDKEYVMGYGIPNTTWTDGYAYIGLPTTRLTDEILPQNNAFLLHPEAGKTYTQTIWIETDANIIDLNAVEVSWFTGKYGHVPVAAKIIKLADNSYKLTSTYTVTKEDSDIRLFDILHLFSALDISNSGTYLKFGKLKVEQGNVSTDWTPAPEDVQTAILSTKSEISDVSLKVDKNKQAIEQRVEKTTYQQDLNLVKGDISKANEGLNKWRYEIYPKSLFADKPEDQSKYDIGVFIRNKNLTPSRTLVFDDNKWTLLDYENNYIGYGLTFVKMSAKKTFSTKWAHSSSCSIYVNGKLIISDKGTVRLDSNNIGRDFNCTFIEGWNCIEFVMQETTGNEWFFFKDAISAISECQLMNCYYGTPVARQSHITNQLVQNTTDIDGVSTKVSKVTSVIGDNGENFTSFKNDYSDFKQTMNGFKTTVGQTYVTKDDFNGLEIGGRNLVRLGGLSSNGATSFSYDKTTDIYTIVSPVVSTVWGIGAAVKYDDNHKVLIPYGKTYILSFEVKVPQALSINIDINNFAVSGSSWAGNDNDDGSMRGQSSYNIPANTWTKVWVRWANTNTKNTNKVDLYDNSSIGLVTKDCTSAITWQIRHVKGELGNKPTDWTPAPEDVNGKIVNVETIANQTAKKFEWIVKGGDSSSNFTLTDRVADLVAERINFKGLVTFSGLNTDAKNEIGKVAQSKVDGLEIGGRNLIINSNLSRTLTNVTNDGCSNMTVVSDSVYGHALKFTAVNQRRVFWATSNVWVKNKTYTVSFVAKSSVTGQKIRPSRSTADWGDDITLTTSYARYTTKITSLDTNAGGTLSFSCTNAVGDITITNVKLEVGNKATDWTPAPEDVSQDATNKASQALTDAKNYSSNAVNWVTNNGSSTTSLNSMVKKWTDGAVSDTAQINGGWIKANTITASKIALADFTNYSQLTRNTADAYGFTVTDDTDGTWFSTKNIKRDQFISEIFPCNGGESYLIEYDISTNAKGANNSTDTKNYIGVAIGVYGYTGTVGSNGLPNKATNIWYADRITGSETAPSIHVKTTITTSTATKQFRVFLQSNGYYFEGTTKIRNLSVRRMYGGTLIVDGSITADKIATDAIKSRNYISSGGTQGSFLNLSDGSFQSPNLSWDSNGNLIAKNANLSGEITATNGSIAGWTIISNKMYTTGSGKYTGIGKYGSAYAFWAGATSNDNGNSAVFKVSHTGKLTATDADITGTITATNGKIGRYDITSTYLMTNSGSNASGIGGNQAFWAGAEDSNSAPFRVGYDGVLWAENAAIRGSIETGNLGDEGDTVSIINGHIGIQGTSNNVEIYSTGFKFGIDGDYYLMSVSEGVKCYRNLYATDFVADGWLYCSEVHSSGAVVIGADSESFYWAHGYQIARGTSWGGVCVGDDSQQLRLYGSSIWASHSISTSDENLKENFTTLDQYENFYMNLNPIGFNYIGDYDGKKTHFGFGAHKTEDVLESEGYDADKFAVVTHRPLVQEDIEKRFGKDVEVDIETEYGVSYTEFIALNTHMIQKTRRELTKVKQEKADLEVRLQAIEAKLGL
ncbi:MAG: tail fiber domain-containing protein [Lachnospiraceae bacterium]|nr:tail fiber domain-containing protein [Lachnospiraceae bacterium]